MCKWEKTPQASWGSKKCGGTHHHGCGWFGNSATTMTGVPVTFTNLRSLILKPRWYRPRHCFNSGQFRSHSPVKPRVSEPRAPPRHGDYGSDIRDWWPYSRFLRDTIRIWSGSIYIFRIIPCTVHYHLPTSKSITAASSTLNSDGTRFCHQSMDISHDDSAYLKIDMSGVVV
jgi:hypothetical protein